MAKLMLNHGRYLWCICESECQDSTKSRQQIMFHF